MDIKSKILTLMILVSMLLATAMCVSVQASPSLLNFADIETVSGAVSVSFGAASGTWGSLYPEQSGYWGGEFGHGAVTAHPSEIPYDVAGYITLNTGGTFARHIELRVLDGIADDSFNVYVKNPAGKWALVYSYTAHPGAGDWKPVAEVWVVHDIYDFPAGKGQGTIVEIKIEPTHVGWSGFNTWGQLGVDYIKLYDY